MNNSASILRFNSALFTRPSAVLAFQVAWLLLATFPAHAAIRVWLNPVSGGWSEAANWSGGVVPVSSDNAYITNNGTFTVTNDTGASFATLALGGVSGTQSLNWLSGSLSGSTTIGTNGAVNLVGAGTKYLYGAITNYGQVVWMSGGGAWYLYGGSGARLENRPGGLLDAQLDGNFLVGSGSPVINNAGTFRKSGGSGTMTIGSFVFGNQGTLQAQIGTIQLPNLYSETPSANLAVSLGGTTPGTQYGHIHFPSAPTFSGKFTVSARNGFTPSPGNSFYVLSYPSASGNFIAMDGLDFGNGLRLEPHFAKTGLTLTTVNLPTSAEVTLSIYHLPSSVLVFWPIEFTGCQLYSTTNLTTPVWTFMPIAGINNTVVPITSLQQYFRLSNL
jgi:hypothetical protein